ncbi:MAG: hypothetical protein WCI36_04705 [bacterium]
MLKANKLQLTRNKLLIIYKLSYDLLFLLLLTFIAVLGAEGLLPGLISSKISFTKITIGIFAVMILITWLGENLQITYAKVNLNRNKIIPIFTLFSFLLIGNSLLKFALWENIIITLATLGVFFLLYEIIFADKE